MAIKIPKLFDDTKKPKDDFGDFGELDDWDSELEDFNFDDDLDPGSREPKSVIKQGATELLKSTLSNLGPAIFKKTREKFRNIDSVIDQGTAIKNELDYIKSEFKSDITPTLNTLKQTGRDLNSKISSFVPEGISDKINKIIGDDIEEPSVPKTPSKEETENLAIQDTLGQIFKEQAKHQDEKEKQEVQDRFIDRSLSKYRHEQTSELLNQIRINTAAERLFKKSTFTAYLKKDLELKYKHLFVAKETLATIQATSKIFESKFNDIILNTSLPDIQKKKLTESLKSGLEQAVATRFSNIGTNAIKNALTKFKQGTKDFVSTADMFTGMIDMLGSMTGMMDFMSPAQLVGDFAGQGLASILGGKISDKLFGENGPLERHGKILDLIAGNVPGMLSGELRRMSSDWTNPLGFFLQDILGINSKSIINKSSSPEEPAIFDNAVKTSLISIIPGYLSKILQQTTNIATGKQNEELVYDTDNHEFISKSLYNKKLLTKTIGTSDFRARRAGEAYGQLAGSFQKVQEAKADSKEFQEGFSKYRPGIQQVLSNADINEEGISFRQLANYINYAKGYDPDASYDHDYITRLLEDVGSHIKDSDEREEYRQNVLEALLKTSYKYKDAKLDESGEVLENEGYKSDIIATNLNTKKLTEFYDTKPDPSRTLHKLQNSGQLGFADKRLISFDGGSFEFNKDAYKKLLTKWNDSTYEISSIASQQRALEDYEELDLDKLSNKEYIQAILDLTTGDTSSATYQASILKAKADKQLSKFVKEFEKYKDDPKLLREVIDQTSKIVKAHGSTAGRSFLAYLDNLDKKEIKNKLKELPKSARSLTTKFWKKLTTKSDSIIKAKEQIEQQKQDFTYSELDDYSDVLTEDISLDSDITPISSKINVLPEKEQKSVNTYDRTKTIVDAIVHFEETFVDYVKYQESLPKTNEVVVRHIQESISGDKKQSAIIASTISSESIVSTDKPSDTEPKTKSSWLSFSNFRKKIKDKKIEASKIINTLADKFKKYEWVEKAQDQETINQVKESIITGKIVTDNQVVKDLTEKYKQYKDDPEVLDTVLEDVRSYASKQAKELKEYAEKSAAADRINAFRKEHETQIQKAKDTYREAKKSGQGIFSSIWDTVTDPFKSKFVDIYSKEITEDGRTPDNTEPLVLAKEIEQGLITFSDDTVVPDSYSIDRPCYKNDRQVITRSHIRQGIYNAKGKEITKRSASYKIGKFAEKAAAASITKSFELAKFGIKTGLRAALFGMGLYGQIYYGLLQLGWSISKGIAKGTIFNKKFWKGLGSLTGTVIGAGGKLLKGAGILAASPILGAVSYLGGKLGFNIPGPFKILKNMNKQKEDKGNEQARSRAGAFRRRNVDDENKNDLQDTTKNVTDNVANVEPKPTILQRIKQQPIDTIRSFFKKKTPEERIVEATEATAKGTKALVKEAKKKDSWWKKIFKIILGIGSFFGLGSNLLSPMDTAIDAIDVADDIKDLTKKKKDIPDTNKTEKKTTKVDKDKKDTTKKDTAKKSESKKKSGSKAQRKQPLPKNSTRKAARKSSQLATTAVTNTVAKQGAKKGIMAALGGLLGPAVAPILGTLGFMEGADLLVSLYESWANKKDNENWLTRERTENALSDQGYNLDMDYDELANEAANRLQDRRNNAEIDNKIQLNKISIEAGGSNKLGTISSPVDSNLVTSPFGPRKVENGSTNHLGIDLRARDGDPIYAMADGKVEYVGGSYGTIVIAHLDNTKTKYVHNSRIGVKKGDLVKSGEFIAKAGGMGPERGNNTYPAHLHFEIIKDKKNLDPERYLLAAGIKLTRKADLPAMIPMSDAGAVAGKEPTAKELNDKNPFTNKDKTTDTSVMSGNTTPAQATNKLAEKYPNSFGETGTLSNDSASSTASGTSTSSELDNVTSSSTKGQYKPNLSERGALSAKFESGPKGSAAINPNDNGKGASYGKYQINEGTKTFAEFLQFCATQGPVGKEVAQKLASTSGKERQKVWVELAEAGRIQELEHRFIEENKYNRALKLIKDSTLQQLINVSPTIQDVLWSTAVQHGEGGARDVFNDNYRSGMSPEEFVRAVYIARQRKSPKTASRYKEELALALSGLQQEGTRLDGANDKDKFTPSVKTPSPTDTTNTLNTDTPGSSSDPSQPVSRKAWGVDTTRTPKVTVHTPELVNKESSDASVRSKFTPSVKTPTTEPKKQETTENTKTTSILDSILTEIKNNAAILNTINESIGGVTTAVGKSTDEFSKILKTFSSNVVKENKPSTFPVPMRKSEPLPTPQLDLSKHQFVNLG